MPRNRRNRGSGNPGRKADETEVLKTDAAKLTRPKLCKPTPRARQDGNSEKRWREADEKEALNTYAATQKKQKASNAFNIWKLINANPTKHPSSYEIRSI